MNGEILDPNGILNYSDEDVEMLPQQPTQANPNPDEIIIQTIPLRNNASIRVVRNVDDLTTYANYIPNFPTSVTHFLKISTAATDDDFGGMLPDGFNANPPRILVIPIRDRYGLLDRWNGSRNAIANPGKSFSRFSSPIGDVGAPRMYQQDADNQDDWDDYPPPVQQQILEDINAINNGQSINAEPIGQPRRSARLEGRPAPSIALNECQGKECLITRAPIKNYGIKLSDGQCYDVNALIQWYQTNNTTTPLRKAYTDEDRRKIEEWMNRRGGKKKSKSKSKKKPKRRTKTRKLKKQKKRQTKSNKKRKM